MLPVCPKCDAALFILNFRDIEVDFCHQCRGLWLGAGELEKLMRQTGAKVDDPLRQFQQEQGSVPPGRKHLCPRCDQSLHEITLGKKGETLTLDRCPCGHGLWFDAEELRQWLEMFPPESGAAKTIDYLHELFSLGLKTESRK